MASTRRLRLSGVSCAADEQQQPHRGGGGAAAGEVAELDPQEQVVGAEGHDADADHEPDAPRGERPAVAEQRDQRLGQREGEDEHRAPAAAA